jgi:hypothetical protein
MGPEAGGLWSDNLGMYETFVPYEDSLQALANLRSNTAILDRSAVFMVTDTAGVIVDTLTSDNAFVPVHRKYTFNLELDAAYDIGRLLGHANDLLLGGYAALSGVATSFVPLAFGDGGRDMLLWSLLLRVEPAVALHPRFYLVGLAGLEVYRSHKTWMARPGQADDRIPVVEPVPLHFRDVAWGVGFDWEPADRAGLHGRVKWFSHADETYPDNSIQSVLGSAELKLWF